VTEPRGDVRPVRVRVVATGRVQGVWFRDACRERARAEGVAGWVRNRADGAIEAEFEGPKASVDRLVTWFGTGPSRARVDTTEITVVEAVGDQRFRIL